MLNSRTRRFLTFSPMRAVYVAPLVSRASINFPQKRDNFFKKKLLYCSPFVWKKIFLFKQSFVFKGTKRNLFNRASIVPHAFVNLPVKIYSGKRWHIRLINPWMVGYKFGEFTWNRKLALYKAKQLKKKKKKKINFHLLSDDRAFTRQKFD